LADLRAVDDDGVNFHSHIDGAKLRLTPEISMQAQSIIGSSIWMCFDWFPGHPATHEQMVQSVERTTTWAERCKQWQATWQTESEHNRSLLFGIVQGGTDAALRARSARELQSIGFDGYAIGGLAVGEPPEVMLETVAATAPLLPSDQVRYLMGVGTPDQILAAVRSGVDLFDCVIPTRNARHGTVFIKRPDADQLIADDLSEVYYQKVHLTGAAVATDMSPIEPGCGCPTCSAGVSRALIRHLFSVQEPLAMTYATAHNVWFYMNMMHQIRQTISNSV
jgi:queuine tRNA-ribosyltransferase